MEVATLALTTLITTFIGSYIGGYLKKKGEKLATHEDVVTGVVNCARDRIAPVERLSHEIGAVRSRVCFGCQARCRLKLKLAVKMPRP